MKIPTQQTNLNSAREQCACCDNEYADLLDTNCKKYQRVLSDHASQQLRMQEYNERLEQFAVSATAFYNSQVSEDVKLTERICEIYCEL